MALAVALAAFTVCFFAWIVPLVLLAVFHDSFAAVVLLGFLLGVTGASFAVGVPFVNRWYDKKRQGLPSGCTEWAWAAP